MHKRSQPLLEFKGITKSFKDKTILKDLNLKIYKKDIFALVGKSGAGKSTLMKILIGFYTADSGKIIYKDKDISKDLNILRNIIGFTTQENSFYEDLTLLENLRYYSKIYNIKKSNLDNYLIDILDSVGLKASSDIFAKDISGGMKRRLDFAISLIHDPDILVLDEPTTGLDPFLVRSFWKIIQDIRSKGKTIIVTSHIFQELEDNCKTIGILDKGRFKEIIDIKDLIKRYNSTDLSQAFQKVIEG